MGSEVLADAARVAGRHRSQATTEATVGNTLKTNKPAEVLHHHAQARAILRKNRHLQSEAYRDGGHGWGSRKCPLRIKETTVDGKTHAHSRNTRIGT